MVSVSDPLLHAPQLSALAVPHAFTTNHGGVSQGPFASLNFGNPGDLPPERRDPPANIAENFRRVLAWLNTPNRRVVEVHQVHGTAVHIARRGAPDHATPRDTQADALVTDDPDRLIAVRVADCAPVLLASGDGRVVAAAHAGWRGAVGGVVPATIDAMRRELGVDPSTVHAAIGPCIDMDHFQVGPEVAEAFAPISRLPAPGLDPATNVVAPDASAPGKFRVSLRHALVRQLLAAGVPPTAIDAPDWCTARESRFFSHRRDAGLTGRMIGIIGPKAATQC